MSKFGSLLGDVAFTLNSNASAVAIQMIPLDRITSDPNNPRKIFDQTQLEEMAQSIKERGILQPITVRPLEGGTSFMVRYGDRRFRAARIAGLTEIRAIVTTADVSEDDLFDQVIENDQRAALTTAEMAEAIGAALARGDKAVDIAKKLGRPKSVIAEYSALQEMPPFLRALADTTAIRTLYELYQGWKADPAKVEAFVANSDGTGIRRAAARELVRGADAVNKRPAPAQAATPNADEPPLPLEPDDKSSSGRTSEPAPNGSTATDSPAATGKDVENLSAPVTKPVAKDATPTTLKGEGKPARATLEKSRAADSREPSLPVMVHGRAARLIMPPVVRVVFDDDGAEESVDPNDVSLLAFGS
ncbi:ParB/RepB/Spo0J family partition protein [Sphingomonas sp. LB2R24]|uniref:ParB/RepB/Spo0J family partition protein n=1 Tax=Sphingomonas sorbitolis TaxID=3096165 RepID=UPI002FC69D53